MMSSLNVDIVFVIDASESMQPCFDALRTHLDKVIQPMQGYVSKVRFGLVAQSAGSVRGVALYDHQFLCGSGMEAMKKLYQRGPNDPDPRNEFFTADPKKFATSLAALKPQGNEEMLLALDVAADFPFGPVNNTKRVIALFSDEPFEGGISKDALNAKIPALSKKLMDRHIQLFVAIPDSPAAQELGQVDRSEIELVDGGNGLKGVDFKQLLGQMGKSISGSSLQATGEPSYQRAIFGQDSWDDTSAIHAGNRDEAMSMGELNPYTQYRGQQQISGAKLDDYRNALGNQYDLAKDGAFKGLQIAVLHLYTGEGFDFRYPENGLKEKGFSIHRWTSPPSTRELQKVLDQSCQLWLIADSTRQLSDEHILIIQKYFQSGRGVFIWGDNDPYYQDANVLTNQLFGVAMFGSVNGDRVVKIRGTDKSGFERHFITTGIGNLYEGITIATVPDSPLLSPLVYGSDGNLVVSICDQLGQRAIIDGGFTKLFLKWDTAGTGRYVKNAAAWLANYERWGDGLFGKSHLE